MTHFVDSVTIGKRGLHKNVRSALAILDFVPATLDRDGICLAQVRSGQGDLILNGTFVGTDGRAKLDQGVESWGRAVGLFSTSALTSLTFNVYGYDSFGQAVRETLSGPGANATVATNKTFAVVTRIAVSGTIGTNVEVGTVDKFGLPMRLFDKSQLVRVGWNAAVADDAATVVIGDGTSPATATTGDVRGTVVPSTAAANGVRRLTVVFVPLVDNQFGVSQFGAGV